MHTCSQHFQADEPICEGSQLSRGRSRRVRLQCQSTQLFGPLANTQTSVLRHPSTVRRTIRGRTIKSTNSRHPTLQALLPPALAKNNPNNPNRKEKNYDEVTSLPPVRHLLLPNPLPFPSIYRCRAAPHHTTPHHNLPFPPLPLLSLSFAYLAIPDHILQYNSYNACI